MAAKEKLGSALAVCRGAELSPALAMAQRTEPRHGLQKIPVLDLALCVGSKGVVTILYCPLGQPATFSLAVRFSR